mgnify:CR=1 FL=1
MRVYSWDDARGVYGALDWMRVPQNMQRPKKSVLRVACCTQHDKTLLFRVNMNTKKGKYATKSDPFIGKTCKKQARLNTIAGVAFGGMDMGHKRGRGEIKKSRVARCTLHTKNEIPLFIGLMKIEESKKCNRLYRRRYKSELNTRHFESIPCTILSSAHLSANKNTKGYP